MPSGLCQVHLPVARCEIAARESWLPSRLHAHRFPKRPFPVRKRRHRVVKGSPISSPASPPHSEGSSACPAPLLALPPSRGWTPDEAPGNTRQQAISKARVRAPAWRGVHSTSQHSAATRSPVASVRAVSQSSVGRGSALVCNACTRAWAQAPESPILAAALALTNHRLPGGGAGQARRGLHRCRGGFGRGKEEAISPSFSVIFKDMPRMREAEPHLWAWRCC